MICYSCQRAFNCECLRYAFNNKFEISNCKNFYESATFRYKHIAEHPALMKLIYDYFTDNVDGHSLEEAKEAITREINKL